MFLQIITCNYDVTGGVPARAPGWSEPGSNKRRLLHTARGPYHGRHHRPVLLVRGMTC